MNKYWVSASITGVGFLGGLCLGASHDDLATKLGFALGGGLVTGAPIAFFYDSKLNQQNKQIESLQATARKINNNLTSEKKSKTDLEKLNKESLNEVLAITKTLEVVAGNLKESCESELIANAEINRLIIRVNELTEECKHLQELCERKESELEEFAKDYDSNLTKEFEAKKQQLVRDEIAKEFELTTEAFQLMNELEEFTKQVYERHQGQREQLLGTNGQYHAHLQKVIANHNEAYDQLMQVKDTLELRIRYLEQTIEDGLVQPIYIDAAFDKNGEIANRIAKELFDDLGLVLAVQGFSARPDGVIDVGYGYKKSIDPVSIIRAIEGYAKELVNRLRIHKITSVRKLEITDCIVVSFRREPALKDSDAKLMAGSAEEFLDYITSQPIRYRLIAEPGTGKTPTTAVMVSAILKEGGTMGNTGKGAKIPHTLVDVSYPDGNTSQKDLHYPLKPFLKYGDTTAAVKSFDDAISDWEYRKHNTKYAANFFQLWVWDELDNTLDSCSDPMAAAANLKKILKQAHHTGVGWIVSGQSVMTKQLPGFTNDDRALFTEIVIGIPKIRKYLEAYGKSRNSQSNLSRLAANLGDLEDYIEAKNALITDDARLLRIALVVDSRSPKLYFLPNLDLANFNTNKIEESRRLANGQKRAILTDHFDREMTDEDENPLPVRIDQNGQRSSFLPIGGNGQSDEKPHCCHCDSRNLKRLSDGRYNCMNCKKRFVESKAIWK